jgi:hypothetical protein
MNVLQSFPSVVNQGGLQWLVFPDERSTGFTNFGDGRKGDASELVATVNADPAQNLGHSDWRLPTTDELKTLIGAADAPKTDVYWSSSPCVGRIDFASFVNFYNGHAGFYYCNILDHVRLVRASQ